MSLLLPPCRVGSSCIFRQCGPETTKVGPSTGSFPPTPDAPPGIRPHVSKMRCSLHLLLTTTLLHVGLGPLCSQQTHLSSGRSREIPVLTLLLTSILGTDGPCQLTVHQWAWKVTNPYELFGGGEGNQGLKYITGFWKRILNSSLYFPPVDKDSRFELPRQVPLRSLLN